MANFQFTDPNQGGGPPGEGGGGSSGDDPGGSCSGPSSGSSGDSSAPCESSLVGVQRKTFLNFIVKPKA